MSTEYNPQKGQKDFFVFFQYYTIHFLLNNHWEHKFVGLIYFNPRDNTFFLLCNTFRIKLIRNYKTI